MPGTNGNLWFRDYLAPYERTAELPAGFDPTWISQSQILGTWLDPDDAPHVRLFRLLR